MVFTEYKTIDNSVIIKNSADPHFKYLEQIQI